MNNIRKYEDLEVWQKAKSMVVGVYDMLKSLPKFEIYGLASQIRRSAVSVPSNIAEGQGRKSTKAFNNHLNIAYGSLMELETQLIIAKELNYLTNSQLSIIRLKTQEVGRMINGLQKAILKNPLPKNYPSPEYPADV